MKILLNQMQVFRKGKAETCSILVEDGRIVSLSKEAPTIPDAFSIELKNGTLFPGFVDVHVHLREPGFSYKETIATGTKAGARGGYTAIFPMPNLKPVPDSVGHLQPELDAIRKDSVIHTYPYGAINAFPTDTEAELKLVEEKCKELGVNVVLSEVWAKGGEGGVALAEEVVRLCEQPNDFTYAYDLEGSIEEKLNAIVQKIYGGSRVVLTANAQKQAKQLEALGFGNCPICMAKTQYSLTDDQTKLGAPTGFEVTVRNLKISAGAGFIVALTGDIMTMPGLPKVPAAERIDVDATGKITGLF